MRQSGGAPWHHIAEDFDGDGYLDLLVPENGALNVALLIGNGDGSFKARTINSVTGTYAVSVGDFDENGAMDFISQGAGASVSVFLANGTRTTTTSHLNINTVSGAKEAMAMLDATLLRINQELGAIGSMQSRLGVALNTKSVERINLLSAAEQIMDADMAEETAQLNRLRIVQQAGAAILAQANMQPTLALQLLGDL